MEEIGKKICILSKFFEVICKIVYYRINLNGSVGFEGFIRVLCFN